MEFLIDCYYEGKGYSIINIYCFVLFIIFCFMKDDRDFFGLYFLIVRLFKGVYVFRLFILRYFFIWDVFKVIDYLKILVFFCELSLKWLIFKIVMLCVLVFV